MKQGNKLELVDKSAGCYIYKVGSCFYRISNLTTSDWNIDEVVKEDGFYNHDASICSRATLKDAIYEVFLIWLLENE